MFVFIAHAEADQAAADDLKAFLKSRGLVVETETGARGFRYLQASDVVIALWSQKSVFGAQRMMMEKRMLDAWADERLVLVKLDHSFLPVGMRDLPAIDASFETGRQLSVWPKVERAAKEAMNAALVAAQPRQGPMGGVPGGGPVPPALSTDGLAAPSIGDPYSPGSGGGPVRAPAARSTSPVPPRGDAFASRAGPTWTGPFLLLGVLLMVGAGVLLFAPALVGDTVRWSVFGAAGVWAVLLVVVIAVAVLAPSKPKRAPSSAPRAKAASAPAPAPATPAAEAAAAAVGGIFISYAHADTAQVEPVVKVVEATGGTIWIDKGGIQAGEGWAGEIVRGIKGATRVMVMCSPRAFESDHIKREVYLADRYKKPMLPVFIAEAQPPEDFEYFFAGVQWLELFKLAEADRPAAIGKALGAV
jgi:hypothetical protein